MSRLPRGHARGDDRRRRDHRQRAAPAPAHRTPRSSPSSRPTATATAPCARPSPRSTGGATPARRRRHRRGARAAPAGIVAPILAWLHAPGASFAEAAAAGIELGISSFDQLRGGGRGIRRSSRRRAPQARDRAGAQRHRARRLRAGCSPRPRGSSASAGSASSGCSATSPTPPPTTTGPRSRRSRRASRSRHPPGLAPPLRHIAATHAAIALPESRLGCVRIGIGMYGLSPFDDRSSADLGLRPAMTLRGVGRRRAAGARRARRLVRLRLPHRARDDARARAARLRRRRAAAGVGRRPGVDRRRALHRRRTDRDGPVRRRRRRPPRSRSATRSCCSATRRSARPSADDWADAAGTINYEIVTRIGPRVPRRQVVGERPRPARRARSEIAYARRHGGSSATQIGADAAARRPRRAHRSARRRQDHPHPRARARASACAARCRARPS